MIFHCGEFVLSFRYDALGVTQEAAEELCQSLNIKFDKEGMNEEMKRVKKGFRDEIAKQVLLNSETNFIRKVESFLSKYKPEYAGGICKPELTINDQEDPIFVEWIFDQDGEPVEEFTGSNKSFWVILSKTIFIPGSHAVSSDVGAVVLKDGSTLNITNVKMLPSGWILHLVSVRFIYFFACPYYKLYI
jgi:alanyl-tRNA synthetase